MPTFTTLINFNGANGATPYASLIADTAGDLYGTTTAGGATNDGTVFEVAATAGTFASTPTILVSFNGTNGATPFGGLIADAFGDLYGTTAAGGASNAGTLYEIAATASGYATTPTTLVSFNGNNGDGPADTLIANATNLLGTTGSGGANGDGTVFAAALFSFNGANGANPYAGLISDAAGNLFGTTINGGASNDGIVFEIPLTASGYAAAPTTLVSFSGANGENPYAGLITDAAGNLFGTTQQGGANGDGTVYEITKAAGGYATAPTILVSFDGANGSNLVAGLIADAAGNLFGTTVGGGANNDGTVFEIAKTITGYASTPTILLSFDGTDGANPVADLTADATGDLFGTTANGGADGNGTVFELTGAGFEVAGPVVTNTTGSQEILVAPVANSSVQGDGFDILDLSQNPIATASSAYALSANGDGTFDLATTGSVDHVSGIMQVAFANETVTIAGNGSENEYIALLYQGALGRTPDAGGLAGWEQIAADLPASAQALGVYGLSDAPGGYNASLSIAAGFTNSPEFIAKYGSLTNQQFVTNLYANILDRAPDPTGLSGWLSQLGAGATREHVLVGFADSQEAISNATLGFTGQSGAHAAWLFVV
jgi:uncharacterized repeat protein (TIGR03803 family)